MFRTSYHYAGLAKHLGSNRQLISIMRQPNLMALSYDPYQSFLYNSLLIMLQIIHCVGIESAPADMLVWAIVKEVREKLACHTKEITGAIWEMKYATINTIYA